MTWQDAHVGTESSSVSFRATDEERERLEQLREELRLTSKGQVLRMALDLLEAMQIGNDTLLGTDKQETRRVMRRARRGLGVPRRKDLESASADDALAKHRHVVTSFAHVVGGGEPGPVVSLPDTAPTPPASGAEDDEQQLELPEMPTREKPNEA